MKKIIPLWSITIVSFLVIIAILSLSIYVRPLSDDFPFLSHHATLNLIDFASFCLSVNGRISSLFLYLIGYSIPGFLFIAPTIGALLIWMGLFLLAKLSLVKYINRDTLFIGSAAIASAILAVTLLVTPGLYSSLFWFASSTVHVWSFGLLMIYLSYICKKQPKELNWRHSAFLFPFIILPFVTSMMSEAVAVMSLTATFAIFIYSKKNLDNYRTQVGLLGMSASLLGLIILYFSPGSVSRRIALKNMGNDSILTNILQTPHKVLRDLFEIIPQILPNKSLLGLLIAAGIIIGIFYVRNKIPTIKLLIVGSTFTTSLVFAYLINVGILFAMTPQPVIPYRMYFLPVLCLAVISTVYGVLIGVYLKKYSKLLQGVVLGALITVCGYTLLHQTYASYMLNLRSSFKNHASEIDLRDISVRAQMESGVCIIVVKELALPGVDDITDDINGPINRNMYNFYNPESAMKTSRLGFLDELPQEPCGITSKLNVTK